MNNVAFFCLISVGYHLVCIAIKFYSGVSSFTQITLVVSMHTKIYDITLVGEKR